ncbi:T-cell receptor-associated transmembrane adapter 1 [Rhynchocyon petersi]
MPVWRQRDDEYYIEDTPIYGNLDNTAPESTDENCYEQMKARPERSMHKPQKDTPLAEAADEAEMCYASLDHSCKDKGSKPRKKKTSASNTHEDEQLHGMSASVSTTTLTGKFLPESQAVEENIHDDPVRLFGLIRAKNDQTN